MPRTCRWLARCACALLACQGQVHAQPSPAPPAAPAPAPAPAPGETVDTPATEQARQLFAEGLDFVESENWVEAEARFRRVLVLRASHVVAYNLASALDHLGRLVEAAELLRPIVRDASADPRTKVAAERLLAELEPSIGSLTVRLSGDMQGAGLRIDDQQAELTEQVLTVSVDPGEHRVTVQRDGIIVASQAVRIGGDAPLQASLALDLPPRLGPVASTPRARSVTPAIGDPAPPAPGSVRAEVLEPSAPERPATAPAQDSLLASWWLWAAVGAVAVGAGVAVAVLAAPGEAKPVQGDTDPPVVRGRVLALELP